MSYSRRDLTLLLPALALASGAAQNRTLPSKTWRFEDLELKKNSRAVLNGETHGGFNIDMHETELPPGESPHPPHHHVHEEMIMIREGIMEVTIAGSVAKISPAAWPMWPQTRSTAGATWELHRRIISCWRWGQRPEPTYESWRIQRLKLTGDPDRAAWKASRRFLTCPTSALQGNWFVV
jgi:hypothetical protein